VYCDQHPGHLSNLTKDKKNTCTQVTCTQTADVRKKTNVYMSM